MREKILVKEKSYFQSKSKDSKSKYSRIMFGLAKFKLISMNISNRFVIVCNIKIVIRMLYHSFEPLLFFYLRVKSHKWFIKIESHLQIAFFFLLYWNLIWFWYNMRKSFRFISIKFFFTFLANHLLSPAAISCNDSVPEFVYVLWFCISNEYFSYDLYYYKLCIGLTVLSVFFNFFQIMWNL